MEHELSEIAKRAQWPRRFTKTRMAGVFAVAVAALLLAGSEIQGVFDFAALAWRVMTTQPVYVAIFLLLFAVWAFFQSAHEERDDFAASEKRARAHADSLLLPLKQRLETAASLNMIYAALHRLEASRNVMDDRYVAVLNFLKPLPPASIDTANAEYQQLVGGLVRKVISFGRELAECSGGEFVLPTHWPVPGNVNNLGVHENRLQDDVKDEYRRLEHFYQAGATAYHRAREVLLARAEAAQAALTAKEADT